MVGGHVGFYEIGVGPRRGLPARFLGAGVKVVGEVFGIGVADFPALGEASF